LTGIVHVVDDDTSFRTAIERRLKKAGYEVMTYSSAQQLLDRLPADNEPSCILLDVRIPGLSGPELQHRLVELGSPLPIIFLTGYADTETTVRTIKAGAEDFLTKPVASEQLLPAIERALQHHETARLQKSKLDGLRALIAKLTPRERQVLQLIAQGHSNKEIAQLLELSVNTVSVHRANLMNALDIHRTAELVLYAIRKGLVSPQ